MPFRLWQMKCLQITSDDFKVNSLNMYVMLQHQVELNFNVMSEISIKRIQLIQQEIYFHMFII